MKVATYLTEYIFILEMCELCLTCVYYSYINDLLYDVLKMLYTFVYLFSIYTLFYLCDVGRNYVLCVIIYTHDCLAVL